MIKHSAEDKGHGRPDIPLVTQNLIIVSTRLNGSNHPNISENIN